MAHKLIVGTLIMHRRCTFTHARKEHYANLMIIYMIANKIKEVVGNLVLSNFDMPYWNIFHELVSEAADDRRFVVEDQHFLDIRAVERAVRFDGVTRIESHCYGQRMEYFPNKDFCRNIFRPTHKMGVSFGPEYLVCPIRGAETLHMVHGDYVQIPLGFYAEVFQKTSLIPVFMGQLDKGVYTNALRQRFPEAIFFPSAGAINDFQTIRQSENILLSVSTFVWLASWLSSAKLIIMPIAGIFNPLQFIGNDLIPYSELQYQFYKFPNYKAVEPNELMESLASVEDKWQRIG